MKKLLTTLLILAFIGTVSAQRWKKYRQEVTLGLGTTWFLCDVGGFNDKPTNSIADINFRSTSWGVFGGYNYYLTKNISLNGQFTYAWLSAKDKHAGNEARKHRNFDIRTHLYEVGILGRYYFIREKFGHAFRLRGAQNGFFYNLSAYATLGVMGLYFNPTGRHPNSSKYHKLYDIGTEGQTVPGSGVKQYSRFTFAIPVGIGAKYSLGTRWNVGAEIMFRKAFSDYLDDVSGVYYDNSEIVKANGGDPEAGWLADPSVKTADNATWTDPGERRGGEKFDDFYMGFMFTASYKFLKGKSFKPRF
jgi:opacity protein-like surface antigen